MNGTIKKIVGQNVRKYREQAGFTQEYVATKLQLGGCDVTRSALAKIEVGQRHLYVDELILLQKILRIPYEKLLQV